MYSKILVPLDGSKLAEAVLPYAAYLAGALQLPLDLIHVSDPETVSPSLHPSRAAEYLQQTAAALPAGLRVRSEVKNGAAAAVIIDSASADTGALIAMATHGQTGGQRWLLGQVAQKVLQAAKNPLLLIRPHDGGQPGGDTRFGNVIVALDGSHLAEQTLPHVVSLASRLALPVTLVRTFNLPSASYFMAAHLPAPDAAALREKTKKEITDYLHAKAGELAAKGVRKVATVIEEGSGAEEIIQLARKTPDSLIAMCTHGRSGMGRWVLGSVTDRVVSNCGAPVLVIRPPSA